MRIEFKEYKSELEILSEVNSLGIAGIDDSDISKYKSKLFTVFRYNGRIVAVKRTTSERVSELRYLLDKMFVTETQQSIKKVSVTKTYRTYNTMVTNRVRSNILYNDNFQAPQAWILKRKDIDIEESCKSSFYLDGIHYYTIDDSEQDITFIVIKNSFQYKHIHLKNSYIKSIIKLHHLNVDKVIVVSDMKIKNINTLFKHSDTKDQLTVYSNVPKPSTLSMIRWGIFKPSSKAMWRGITLNAEDNTITLDKTSDVVLKFNKQIDDNKLLLDIVLCKAQVSKKELVDKIIKYIDSLEDVKIAYLQLSKKSLFIVNNLVRKYKLIKESDNMYIYIKDDSLVEEAILNPIMKISKESGISYQYVELPAMVNVIDKRGVEY